MARDVRAYPWNLVAKVCRREQALVAAFTGGWPRAKPVADPPPALLSPLRVRVGAVRAYDRASLQQRLAEPSHAALIVRRADGHQAFAVFAGAAAAALTAILLTGRQDELSAPRLPTLAERGVAAYVAALLLARYGIEGSVDSRGVPAGAVADQLEGERALGVDLRLAAGPGVADVFIVAPEAIAAASPAVRPAAELVSDCGHRLGGVRVALPVVSGVGYLTCDEVVGLSRRDVILLDQAPQGESGHLLVAGGWIPVALGQDAVTVRGDYQRGSLMNEAIAEDMKVELACQIGSVTLSARELMELQSGHVLSLSRPLGGPVDLIAGGKIIGRGELVDVDGEVGVRVLNLVDS